MGKMTHGLQSSQKQPKNSVSPHAQFALQKKLSEYLTLLHGKTEHDLIRYCLLRHTRTQLSTRFLNGFSGTLTVAELQAWTWFRHFINFLFSSFILVFLWFFRNHALLSGIIKLLGQSVSFQV